MKIGFIGAGKVGFSLGKYFQTHGICVMGYYSRRQESSKEAADFTDSKQYDSIPTLVSECDTVFLTVPDDQIVTVWDSMKDLNIKNKNICHCSGSVSSTAFFDGLKTGAYFYSIHPLYAVSSKYESYYKLQEAYFSIEGSAEHLQDMTQMLEKTGCRVIPITAEQKTLYHCAAVVASNLVVGLYALAVDILGYCGFQQTDAGKALMPLFCGNAQNIEMHGIVESLTGPVERADVATVCHHLSSLRQISPEQEREQLMQIYLLLSEKLVELAKQKHPNRDYAKIMEVIANEKYDCYISSAKR